MNIKAVALKMVRVDTNQGLGNYSGKKLFEIILANLPIF